MSDTLMVSVSGVRGIVGKDLTPEVVARYAAAFATLALEAGRSSVVLARDARTSGPMFAAAAQAGVQSVGGDVIDCGLIPTPTAQLAVEYHEAAGGIVITASHNPVEWNALKFIGSDGLFLNRERASRLFALFERSDLERSAWNDIGGLRCDADAVDRHREAVLGLDVIDVDAIRKRRFRVALDCVRGAGGTIMPALLEALGCTVVGLELETDGRFSRSPEPIPQNLDRLGALVRDSGAAFGIAVDPDVDRLAIVDEQGQAIGEDYTLAFAVRAALALRPGPVVVNLSTSLVVDDAAREFGIAVDRAPVGEANVAHVMLRANAVVGGEGNGGVMLPALHVGRDAPVAAALVLSLLATTGRTVRELVNAAPRYVIVKAKTERGAALDPIFAALAEHFQGAAVDRQDGVRFAWPDSWLHVRPSGTEPIVRFIAEARSADGADRLISEARTIFENHRTR